MREETKSRKYSLRFKIIAFILAFAFVFQSLDTINYHTYSVKGVSIHRHNCSTPIHLTYYCEEIEATIFW